MGIFNWLKSKKNINSESANIASISSYEPQNIVPRTIHSEVPKIYAALATVFELEDFNVDTYFKDIYAPESFSKSVIVYCSEAYPKANANHMLYNVIHFSYLGAILSTTLLKDMPSSLNIWDATFSAIMNFEGNNASSSPEKKLGYAIDALTENIPETQTKISKIKKYYTDETRFLISQELFETDPESLFTITKHAYLLGLMAAKSIVTFQADEVLEEFDLARLKSSDLFDHSVISKEFKKYLIENLYYTESEANFVVESDFKNPYDAPYIMEEYEGNFKVDGKEYEVRSCHTDFSAVGLYHLADTPPFEFYMFFDVDTMPDKTIGSYQNAKKMYILKK